MLREKIADDCLGLLDFLNLLKAPFDSEHALMHQLSLLNRRYLSLVDKLDYEPQSVRLRLVDKKGDLVKFRCPVSGFCVVVSGRHGVIGVSTGCGQINERALRFASGSNDVIQDLDMFLSLYVDYKARACDACLELVNPDFEYPCERVVEDDYVAAYHTECFEMEEMRYNQEMKDDPSLTGAVL